MNCSADSIPRSKTAAVLAGPAAPIEVHQRGDRSLVHRPAVGTRASDDRMRVAQRSSSVGAAVRLRVLAAARRRRGLADEDLPAGRRVAGAGRGAKGPSIVMRSTEGSPMMSRPSMVVRRNGLIRSSRAAWLFSTVVAQSVCVPAFTGTGRSGADPGPRRTCRGFRPSSGNLRGRRRSPAPAARRPSRSRSRADLPCRASDRKCSARAGP